MCVKQRESDKIRHIRKRRGDVWVCGCKRERERLHEKESMCDHGAL